MLGLDHGPLVVHEQLDLLHEVSIATVDDRITIGSRERARAAIQKLVVNEAVVHLGNLKALRSCLNSNLARCKSIVFTLSVRSESNAIDIGLPVELVVIKLDGRFSDI